MAEDFSIVLPSDWNGRLVECCTVWIDLAGEQDLRLRTGAPSVSVAVIMTVALGNLIGGSAARRGDTEADLERLVSRLCGDLSEAARRAWLANASAGSRS